MSRRIREHAMIQKRLSYLPHVSEASWNIHTNAARQGMGYQHGPIAFSHFTNRMIPERITVVCLHTGTRRFIWKSQ
jgi:hypothetical protein